MFHLYFTIAYLIPSIYAYIRIKSFFYEKRNKNIFSIFYLILLLIFPITEYLSHRSDIGDISVLLKFGYYVMPYFLYLFMVTIVIDIFLIGAHLLRIIPLKAFRSHKLRKVMVPVILLLPAIVVLAGIINHNHIKIAGYSIKIPARSSTLKHLRIAFAADFHIKGKDSNRAIEQFTEKTNSLNPDIVLLGGDIFEGDRSDIDMLFLKKYFAQLKPKYGMYTVFGNHEYHGEHEKIKLFNSLGIQVLLDKILKIDNKFYLAGRNDERSYNRKSINEILDPIPDNLPVILLDHRPTDIDKVSKSKVDIQLSGHTHNGQLFPFNYIVKSIYDLAYGHKKIGNTDFFVTSGVQTWGPAVRTTGSSEILIIDIGLI